MGKSKKIIISISISVLTLIILIILSITWSIDVISPGGPKYAMIEIRSLENNDRVFLKRAVWGLLGNWEERVISTDSGGKFNYMAPNDSTDYILGSSPIFFKFNNDTLYIYNDNISPVPPAFSSRIHIKQIELKNPEMMDLYNPDTCAKRGLMKF